MPPFKQVISLESLSLQSFSLVVSNAIVSLVDGAYERSKCLKDKKKSTDSMLIIPMKEVQRIKKYIGQSIPKNMRTENFHLVIERITSKLLKTDKLLFKNKKSLKPTDQLSRLDDSYSYVFAILLVKEIDALNYGPILHEAMKWIDTSRLNCRGTKDVPLNYTNIETVFLKHLAENANALSNVVSLSWPHLISGDLVRIVGRHLKGLKILVLACCCEMGPFIEEERKGVGTSGCQDDLISSLVALFDRSPGDFIHKTPMGCPKLKKLVLPNLEDDDRKAAVILKDAFIALPHLEYVSGISTLTSLAFLREKARPQKLSLKNISDYDQFQKRIFPEVNFLKDLLPNLEQIELRVSQDLSKRVIKLFPDIQVLSVEWPDFHLFARQYNCLVSLNLSMDFQCCWSLLLALSRSCKELKHITLEQPTFQVDPSHLENIRIPKLPKLLSFRLIRSSFIEFTAFKTFILGCPDLEELDITLSNDRNYMVDEFGDQLIRAIAPQLKHLKKFSAESLYKYNLYLHINCILSISAADILIRNCPKLSFIGHFDSWDVTDAEVRELSKTAKDKNWDLQIG